MAEDVGQAYIDVVPSLKGFSAKLRTQLAAELRGIDGPVNEAGRRAGAGFGDRLHEGIKSRLAGISQMLKTGLLVGSAAAVAGLGAVTAFGLKSAAALEQTQIGFESLLGSGEEAKNFLAELQAFAAKTPFEFQGVADASRRILAFGQSVGIARDQVIPTITTIGDLASVLGVGQNEIDGVVRALGQIASKGKVSQEELLQIAEQFPGFNANAAIASALGLSVADSMQLITAGGVDAKTGIDALLQGMKNFGGAAGAMEKQSQTLLGVFSTFKDTLGISLTNAFQPVIPSIKQALTDLTPVIGAAFDQLGPALGGVLTALLPLIGQLVQGIVPVLTPLLDLVSGLVSSIGGLDILAPIGQAIGAALQPLLGLVAPIGALLGALAPTAIALTGAFTPLITALVNGLVPILYALMPVLQPIIDAFTGALAPIIKVVAKALQVLAPIIAGVVLAVGTLLAPILKALAPVFAVVLKALEPLLPVLGDLLAPVVQLALALVPLAEVLGALLIAVLPILDPLLRLTTFMITLLAQKAVVPLVELLAKALTLLIEPLVGVVGLVAAFAGWLSRLDWAGIGRAIGGAFADAWHAVAGFFGDVGRWFANLPGQIKGALAGAGSWLWSAGRDLIYGLWNGVSSLGGWLWSKVRSFVADNVTGAVKGFLGIASPSKVFAGIGENVVAGYVKGVEDSARAASLATTSALAPAASQAQRAALAPAPQRVVVTAGDDLIAKALDSMRDAIGRKYGGDVVFALGSVA